MLLAIFQAWTGRSAAAALRLALFGLIVALAPPGTALAADKAKLLVTAEPGFGRLVLDFPDRMDLPAYSIHSDNGVLTLGFDEPVDISMPDIATALPDYISVARMDPDGRGIRFGLRTTLTLDHIEAGEKLFIDLLPPTWQGAPPPLPPEIVAELAQRAKEAALLAEQRRKAEGARTLKPVATLHVGRNPTFMRVEVQWNVDTGAKFAMDGTHGNLDFEWPVAIDTYLLKSGLPDEVLGVDNAVTADGSRLVFRTAEGVTPRFYALSPRDYIVDIDTASTVPADPDPVAAATAKQVANAVAATQGAPKLSGPVALADGSMRWAALALTPYNHKPAPPITPVARVVGSTVRVSFPFDRETAAAVFRRGGSLWMLFDTSGAINQPDVPPALMTLLKSFTVVPTGDAQVVRLDLGTDKLATLGSEGDAWVLSIGDMLLAPTAPLALSRRADRQGLYSVAANLDRPGKVHSFSDPVVGDTLQVVTAFPPARGMARELDYVDFSALRSVQGLVVRPEHPDVKVGINGGAAVISAAGGLTVSPPDLARRETAAIPPPSRDGYLDLANYEDSNPLTFGQKIAAKTNAASNTDGTARQVARLDLAKLYVANDFGPEAVGVLQLLLHDAKGDDLRRPARLALAAADVSAHRPADALDILNDQTFADDVDAHMWRSIAETDANSFASARRDALAAEPVIAGYPIWVRTRFLLDAVRSSIEMGDTGSAEHFYKQFDFADLDPDQVTEFQLLGGRIAEAEGRADEALDTYGQVISADVRPTRAEAVYRTILILDRQGKLNLPKATATLAAEALLWRGDLQEARMDELLASLYFRSGQYRPGFTTAKQAAISFPSSPAVDALTSEAQAQFENLFVDGKADSLPAIQALALFYDFRSLTPPGPRGDQVIRNLAERLVKVDLLPQAAQLLSYQIDNRLSGAAKAQVATELAVIYIANHQPAEALKTLNFSQIAQLPTNLDRQRRVLEARALIDVNRNDLALDLLSSVEGRDADLLRVEAYWNNKAYDAASSLLEVMYSPSANGGSTALQQSGRMNLVKAAVGYALAGDKIGLSRLRSKFADAMAMGAEWPMFDYVTSTIKPTSGPEFAKVLRAISGIDTLDAFLASYRHTYGEDAGIIPDVTPANNVAAPTTASTAPATPQPGQAG